MASTAKCLRALVTTDDHERGCQGRCYSCSCGYDDRLESAIVDAADEIERLRTVLDELSQHDLPAGVRKIVYAALCD